MNLRHKTNYLIFPALALGLLFSFGITSCGDDTNCLTQDCPCGDIYDCPNGEHICYEGQCYPDDHYPPGAACESSGDCHDTSICQDRENICVQLCDYPDSGGCTSGFVCHSNSQCLPMHSFELDDACFDSRICPEGTSCPAEIFQCKVLCVNGYSTSECPPDRYCAVNSTPTCDVSRCVPGTPNACATPRICIDLGDDVGVCRHPCIYDYPEGGSYSDDCPDQIGYYPATCAPLGADEAPICIEAASTGGLTGASCNMAALRCRKGNICLSGKCRATCKTEGNCGTGYDCKSVGTAISACLP